MFPPEPNTNTTQQHNWKKGSSSPREASVISTILADLRKLRHFHFIFFVKPDLCNYFFNIETMGIVRHGLYRQPWPSFARSAATRLFPASWATPGAAAAWQRQAARRRHLQRGVSSGSVVAALAERRRQRGSGLATAGSAARQAAAERWWWREHGGGVGSAVPALAARWQRWQKQHSSSLAEASTPETASAAR